MSGKDDEIVFTAFFRALHDLPGELKFSYDEVQEVAADSTSTVMPLASFL